MGRCTDGCLESTALLSKNSLSLASPFNNSSHWLAADQSVYNLRVTILAYLLIGVSFLVANIGVAQLFEDNRETAASAILLTAIYALMLGSLILWRVAGTA